jgi:2-iminobutanoate/2-iminopropanoate deaminase
MMKVERTMASLVTLISIASASGCAAVTSGRSIIASGDAPAAIGPYSQAVVANGVLYASGQLGIIKATGQLASSDTAGQAEQALTNLRAVVTAAGMTMDDVVSVQIYMIDLAEYSTVNTIYSKFFTQYPARATVQVARLPRDARIEMSLVAVKRQSTEVKR